MDDDGRPTGSVRSGAGPAVAFVGWLALMAELSRRVAEQGGIV